MDLFKWFRPKPAEAKRAITYAMGQSAGLVTSPVRSGVHVTEANALGVSAVWCAVNVIAGAIGKLPLTMYRKRKGGGHDIEDSHPLSALLDQEPNPEMTARVFWETVVAHSLLYGNLFAEIVRDGSGRPVALWPIHPQYVQVLRDTTTGGLFYRVTLPANAAVEPGQAGTVVNLAAADVLHVPGISPDGSYGYQLLSLCREAIGFSIATDRFGQAFFGAGARPGQVLEFPPNFDEQAKSNVIDSVRQTYTGVEATGRTLVLEDGAKLTPLEYSADASQYDETRKFQITEVSRLFNITPVKLHELGRATWGNLSTLNADFWDTSCSNLAGKIEAECERKLLLPGERGRYCIEFDASVLLRGDIMTRYQAYNVGIQGGYLTPELVCEWENLPLPPKPEPAPAPAPQPDPNQEATDPTADQEDTSNAA